MKRWILSVLSILLVLTMALPVLALADEDTIVEGVDYYLVEHYPVYSLKEGLKLYNKQTRKSHSVRQLAYGEEMIVEAVSADGLWLGITYQKKGKTRFAWAQKEYLSDIRPSGGSPAPAPTPAPAPEKKKKTAEKTQEQKQAEAAKAAEQAKRQIDSVLGSMTVVAPYNAMITTKTVDGTVALRWQPTTEGKLIGYLPNGTRLTVLAEGDGWFQVTDEQNGSTGFMSSRYITRVATQSAPVETLPVEILPVETLPSSAEPAVVAPLTKSVDVANLPDGTWPVSFNGGDVLSGASGIFMNAVHVFAMDLYDAVAVNALAEGDTLVVEGAPHAVTSVQRSGETVVVNGGMDADGWELAPVDGSVYRVFGYNDMATYTELGVASLMLAPEATYVDGFDLDAPAQTVQYGGIVEAIATVEPDSFSVYNTTLRTEGGRVVEINRAYMP